MAKKHLFQLRRKDARAGQRDPWYNPERDLAHVGPHIVAGAMRAMEERFWEPWLKEFLNKHGITYDTIADSGAPLMLAKAVNRIVKLENPVVAMAESGFDKLPPEIQMLFYTRMGQVLLSAIWSGVKDVSRPDSDPPIAIAELLEEIECNFLGSDATPSPDASDTTAAN